MFDWFGWLCSLSRLSKLSRFYSFLRLSGFGSLFLFDEVFSFAVHGRLDRFSGFSKFFRLFRCFVLVRLFGAFHLFTVIVFLPVGLLLRQAVSFICQVGYRDRLADIKRLSLVCFMGTVLSLRHVTLIVCLVRGFLGVWHLGDVDRGGVGGISLVTRLQLVGTCRAATLVAPDDDRHDCGDQCQDNGQKPNGDRCDIGALNRPSQRQCRGFRTVCRGQYGHRVRNGFQCERRAPLAGCLIQPHVIIQRVRNRGPRLSFFLGSLSFGLCLAIGR